MRMRPKVQLPNKSMDFFLEPNNANKTIMQSKYDHFQTTTYFGGKRVPIFQSEGEIHLTKNRWPITNQIQPPPKPRKSMKGKIKLKLPSSLILTIHHSIFVIIFWLVVLTHLKNISQTGNLPQIVMKIKNI